MLDSVSLTDRHTADGGTIIEIEAVGEIESGSSGNESSNALRVHIAEIINQERPGAVLFDFGRLRYEFGDAVLTFTLALHDSTTMTWRPGVILPSTASMPDFVSLLAATRIPMVRLAVSKADALQQLESWLTGVRAERANSTEFRRRALEALISVLEVRGSLPEWKSEDVDDRIEGCWMTSFKESGVPYFLAIGGATVLVRVGIEEVLVSPGHDFSIQSAAIDRIADLIRSCLAGEPPSRLFAAMRSNPDHGPVP